MDHKERTTWLYEERITALLHSSSSLASSQSTLPSHLEVIRESIKVFFFLKKLGLKPALHGDTLGIYTGELILLTASEGQPDLVRVVG